MYNLGVLSHCLFSGTRNLWNGMDLWNGMENGTRKGFIGMQIRVNSSMLSLMDI